MQKQMGRVNTILKAALTYFAIVFAAGFVLGPIRIWLVVPRLGPRLAELIEALVMLAVIVVCARWLVKKFQLAANALPVGLLALALMIAVEFTLVLKLRGLTLGDYFQERDPVAGSVYYLLLLFYAVLPSLFRRKTQF